MIRLVQSGSSSLRVAGAATALLVLSGLVAGCSSPDAESSADSTTRSTSGSSTAEVVGSEMVPGKAWARVEPADAALDPAVLDTIAKDASGDSYCLTVVKDGRVAYERNFRGHQSDDPLEAFSVTKSFASTMVGIAEADGDLSLADPASTFIPQWKNTDSADVTVRNLISNDSGRFWSLSSDYVQLLQARDRTRFAIDLKQAAPPGTVWNYNNAAIQTLDRVISTATEQPTSQFGADRILKPIGMTNSSFTGGPNDSTLMFMGLQSTCPDLARFGLLAMRDGKWGDQQVVPSGWFTQAAIPGSLNPAYGFLWWLHTEKPFKPAVGGTSKAAFFPDAPDDTFAALGLGGQMVVVIPSQKLVISRMAAEDQSDPVGGSFGQELPARVVSAVTD